jgi:anti-sigma B factor antagonist
MSELAAQDMVEALDSTRPGAVAGRGRVMRVTLEGEIGRDEHQGISALLLRLAEAEVHQVVLDLSGVSHFDYRGVRPLMRRADAFRELGGDVRLCGLSPYLFAIFQSAGAAEAFDYHATAQDAEASFGRGRFLEGR